MTLRTLLWFCAAVVLWSGAGCDRAPSVAPTAEIDEPAYRRGKELLRQGRNQEALAAFLRVVEARGDDAPESNLEIGLLYQRQIRDPIAAIFHFRKFLESKPNSPQADLVRQQIAAATRDFARTLPGQPHENQVMRSDLLEVVERLQRENAELKDQLLAQRTNAALSSSSSRPTVADLSYQPMPAPTPGPAVSSGGGVVDTSARLTDSAVSPISRAPLVEEPPPALQPPTRPGEATVPAGGRRHLVARGDTLYSLAQRYYSNRSRWRDIYAANRSRMSNETDLRVGMELTIPP